MEMRLFYTGADSNGRETSKEPDNRRQGRAQRPGAPVGKKPVGVRITVSAREEPSSLATSERSK